MNFFDKTRITLAQLISPKGGKEFNPYNEAFLQFTGGGYTRYDANAPTYINEGYNINPIVFSVIDQMSRKTASIPFYIRKVKDPGSLQKLRNLDNATKGVMTMQQQIRRILLEVKAYEKSDLPFPMERPNANQSWKEFLALYKVFLKSTGNVYIYMLAPQDGADAGVPQQVYLLPSQFIKIVVKDKANFMMDENPVEGYMLINGNQYVTFPAENVIHVKYSNPNYDQNGAHLYGLSPLRAALKNIESGNEALNLNIKTLKSGGAFGFIHGKNNPITVEQAAEIKDRMLEMHTDPANLAKIGGVSAEIGFTRLSLTSDELKPFDYLSFDQKQICNVLGWDDLLLNNDAGAKYDNMAQTKRVVTDNILPDLEMLAEALEEHFLPRFKGYESVEMIFDITELPEMQQDTAEMATWLNHALDRGVINRNEYRVAIKYMEVEEEVMNIFTVQNDVITLQEAVDNDFNTPEKEPNPDGEPKKPKNPKTE